MKFQDLPLVYAVRHSLNVKKFSTVGVAGFKLEVKSQAFGESSKVNTILYIFKVKCIFN